MHARSLRRFSTLVGSIAAATVLFVGAGAAAETSDKRFGQEVLEILRDEGKIDEARYEELRKLEEAEHKEAAKPTPAEPDPEGFTVKYSNGLQFKRNDGQVKIKFGGRIQADFATIDVDSDLRNAIDTQGTVDPMDDERIGGDGEGVEFRRTRLYVSGDLYDRIIFKSQFDFAGGDVSLKDQYIGIKIFPIWAPSSSGI